MTSLRLDESAEATQYAGVMGSRWPLTGRAEELRAIAESVDTVGAAGIVLAGAAGVGKTRLARETLASAGRRGRGCRLVAATASAQSVPLGAFADFADRLGPDPLARVRDVVDAVTQTSRDRPPVVVGVDDAHLLDEQSALVVHQIVRRHLATVVLTVRTGEAAPDAITALWKDELLPRLEVQPLSRAETAALLETVLGDLVDSATAERMWNYTRGNVLYLRQLVDDEVASGHLARRSGIWTWDTHPTVSATLAELIDATMGRQPPHVLDVLDVLAVADSLELDILRSLVGAAAIEEAEAGNLVTLDGESVNPIARLAHPMFGEVRRMRASSLRLRRFRSAIVAASPPLQGRTDPVQQVHRAALLIDSDTRPDPQVLIDAASAGIQLMDPVVAERLARHAVEYGGGTPARVMHINALVNGGRLDEALTVNADLRAHASTPHERALFGLMRAGIFVRQNATEAAAQELERIEDLAATAGLSRTFNCVAAATRAFEEDPRSAVDAAIAGLTGPGLLAESAESAESAEFAGVLGLVTACRDLGRIDTIRGYVERGYRLARTSPSIATSRFPLYLVHHEALQLAGYLTEADDVAGSVDEEPMEFALAVAFRGLIRGCAFAGRGNLGAANRFFAEATAAAETLEIDWIRSSIHLAMSTALAMAGDRERSRTALESVSPEDPFGQRFEFAEMAHAWLTASDGLVGEAIAIITDAARRAQTMHGPAREVWCLQTAAQFGDPSGAARLAELTTVVQGPRVTVAAAHAAALRDSDGDGLLSAARGYEEFGDRVAAGDAAAQAAVAFRDHGRRGAAMTATALARRLAADTGADTPALRANDSPIPLTPRQREIITLAGHGWSNRQIAEHLTMSVRTVEGHLLRASQRTGVNGRDELIALLTGT